MGQGWLSRAVQRQHAISAAPQYPELTRTLMGLPGGATSRHNEVQSQVAFDSRQSAGGATNALSLKLAQLLHPHAGMGAR